MSTRSFDRSVRCFILLCQKNSERKLQSFCARFFQQQKAYLIQLLCEQLVDDLRVALPFHLFHALANEKAEKTGLANAREVLLENAYYIITPTTKSPSPAVEELTGLVRSLGAIPLVLGYEQHDYATAAISHLPHVIAYSLVNLVQESDDENEIMKTIAAGGFKDITRIASSSPVMWENQEQILKLLDNYIHTLEVMRTNIADADSPALLDAFTAAKDYRDSITITAKGALKNVYELYLDLIDETGGIATVATILASNNLSIKNIGIIHNREFEGGVLRLEMYDGESLALAVALLKKHHYTIYER